MKIHSMQSKFLITIISAMLAIAVFIGGMSIYEVDNYIQSQTGKFIHTTCKNEALQINASFYDMEKSVKIMESYVLDFIESKDDITNRKWQDEVINHAGEMFSEVAKHTSDTVAYYLRFDPSISNNVSGLFYSKVKGEGDFVRFETTDLSMYDKDDTEHVGWFWEPYEAQRPIWMPPYYNQNNDILMISYVIPMYYENQFIGIVGMDFNYAVLTDKIDQIKMYEHGYAYLESNGYIEYHNELESGSKVPDISNDYLQVSEPIRNGMTLVLSANYDDIRKIRYEIGFKILFVVFFLATLFSLIVILIVKRIVKPLERLTDASKKLANGNYDVEVVYSNTYEINLLSTAFKNMATHLKEHEKLQNFLAYRDSLTGLQNTTAYKAWVNNFNKEIAYPKIDFGVILFDINYLKETNDRYGHEVGNKLIVSASQIISGIFKRSPVFRIGGDEFLVILQDRDLENCEKLIEKFELECLNERVTVGEKSIPVSIAKGFARYEGDKDFEFITVFNRADDAMYENKKKMKGQN